MLRQTLSPVFRISVFRMPVARFVFSGFAFVLVGLLLAATPLSAGAVCGDGMIDPGFTETCDEGANNGTPASCCGCVPTLPACGGSAFPSCGGSCPSGLECEPYSYQTGNGCACANPAPCGTGTCGGGLQCPAGFYCGIATGFCFCGPLP